MQLNKILEYVAYAVGGIALFLASLLVFALTAGVPAHQVAIVGGLFPEPAPTTNDAVVSKDPNEQPARPKIQAKTLDEVIQGTISRLPTQAVASPFESNELESLVSDVKRLKLQYERDLDSIKNRELEVADRSLALEERAKLLDDFMNQLDHREKEISLRQAELRRDEAVADENEAEMWKVRARPFADGELETATAQLIAYGPEEGAHILMNLDEDRRNELLNSLGDQFKDFNDAFSALNQ
jgi:hypothetical protein